MPVYSVQLVEESWFDIEADSAEAAEKNLKQLIDDGALPAPVDYTWSIEVAEAELTPPPADDVGQFRDASDLAPGRP